jgi:hypothetical protein
LFCLFSQAALTAAVGAVLVWSSPGALVPTAIGLGIIAYALAVVIYSLLSVWRMRRVLG